MFLPRRRGFEGSSFAYDEAAISVNYIPPRSSCFTNIKPRWNKRILKRRRIKRRFLIYISQCNEAAEIRFIHYYICSTLTGLFSTILSFHEFFKVLSKFKFRPIEWYFEFIELSIFNCLYFF